MMKLNWRFANSAPGRNYLARQTLFQKTFYHFLDGGPGWTRTNDVSKVTGLQPATLAARLLTHIMPCQIYIQPQF